MRLYVALAALAIVSLASEAALVEQLPPELLETDAAVFKQAQLGESLETGESMLLYSGEREAVFNGQPEMSLGEIQATVMGTSQLSEQGMQHFRSKFIKLAHAMKEPRLKESAIMMEQMSMDALDAKKKRSYASDQGGMRLVYKRIADLEAKTKQEGKDDHKFIMTTRKECLKTFKSTSRMITTATATQSDNDTLIKGDAIQINKNRADWQLSVEASEKVHHEYLEVMKDRQVQMEETAERVDERSKALDVLTKAIFIVCEKFKRFANTAQCIRVKSQPDVAEPPAASFPKTDGKTLRNDKRKTRMFEQSMEEKWAALKKSDEKKIDKDNPEGLPIPKEGDDDGLSGAVPTLAESNDSLPNAPLTKDEHREVVSLKKLSVVPMQSKFSVPMAELVIALKQGKTKKAINIVQILIDVKDAVQKEQNVDKTELMGALDDFYKKTWQLQAQLAKEKKMQDEKMSDSEMRRVRIAEKVKDNEHQRQTIKLQKKIKWKEEDRCGKIEEEYGVREAIRIEDLENLTKLTSLLRALYNKVMPVECPVGLFPPKARCTNQDHGWCVFSASKGPEQRCSCNAGYYGKACELTMCPGLGSIVHKHDTEAACSGHGTCNSMTGKCDKCAEGYLHGPKKACDYKACPGSGETGEEMDGKCSGHGKCDKIRGFCRCAYEYSGEGCFHRKCPASNSVLYPMTSGNACDGRGACSPKTGLCSCKAPYSGKTCEKKACPANCMNRGTCNESTGKCFCKAPFFGPRCEFRSCPDDCSGGGWCDNITGKCLCKMGHGGDACKKVQYCDAKDASTPEANWYTLWDKPGWALCPEGQALYALYRTKCQALSCLNSAKCGGLCEGAGKTAFKLKVRHCYHALEWYNSFDKEGWSTCDPNYFIIGLYRSCDSLYCLQMAKCCSFKDARWAQCEELNWGSKFNSQAWAEAPAGKWLTAMWRSKGHELQNLDKVKTCTFARKF